MEVGLCHILEKLGLPRGLLHILFTEVVRVSSSAAARFRVWVLELWVGLRVSGFSFQFGSRW